MELSTNIGYLRKRRNTTNLRTYKECAEILKKAGFKYVDFSGNGYLMNNDWKETTLNIKEDFEKIGITVDQTHAPFNYNDYDEGTFKIHMQRAFEISNMVDAPNIVIHADKYTPDENGYDFDKALNTIYDFYAPYVEYAISKGMGVAIENLFDRKDGVRTRFTSTIEEQKAIIEKFNDPLVTACWDTGHAKVSYGDKHLAALKEMSSIVTCTHIHDNIYETDLHQNLFFGDCNWEELIKILNEAKYPGKFTFEMVYGCLPDEFIQKYMTLFYQTGKYLVNM